MKRLVWSILCGTAGAVLFVFQQTVTGEINQGYQPQTLAGAIGYLIGLGTVPFAMGFCLRWFTWRKAPQQP